MRDTKDCIVNSRVGKRHKKMLKEVMNMTHFNQSEFIRFAIEEGYKNILMNSSLAKGSMQKST